jgi:hypothetical protein
MRLLVTEKRIMNCWKNIIRPHTPSKFKCWRGEFWLVLAYTEFGYTDPEFADGEESYNCRVELGLLGLGFELDFCVITKHGFEEHWDEYDD